MIYFSDFGITKRFGMGCPFSLSMTLSLPQIIQLEKDYEVPLYAKRGISMSKGTGIYLFDTQGKRYIDCMTNIGVNSLGYGNKEISVAIAEQIERLPSCHQSFYSEERVLLLQELHDILPASLTKIIFTNSGAEAVEAALKLARAVTGKKTFIAAVNSYHGRTFGALSATGQEKYRLPFLPLLPEFIHVPFNDIPAIESAITGDTAAIILEPIQGEGGIILPQKEYLKKVKHLCETKQILLIADEVQSAIRTGSWLASEQYDCIPDIVCIAKSFSYGLPFGFVATTQSLAEAMPKGSHGSTFAGYPVACTAAAKVIQYIKQHDLLSNVAIVGKYFMQQLQSIDSPVIKEVRGKGLMIGLELTEPPTPYLKKMQEHGLIAMPTSGNTIRFLPPITFSKENVDEVMQIMHKIFLMKC